LPEGLTERLVLPQGERQRVALAIQYIGTHLHGWQRQPNQRTVQTEIEGILNSVAPHQQIRVHGAGRTDSGVHAAAQIAHFDVCSPVPTENWKAILNTRLPDDIMIRGSVAVPDDWHARFSAQWRRYRYTIYTDALPNLFLAPYSWHYYHAPLDEVLMAKTLQPLLGRHHLSAFHRSNSSRPHSWVDVQAVSCRRSGSLIQIEIQANGFLYGMVRLLVGLLVKVGAGELDAESFTHIWQQEDRPAVKHSAPAKGLCLLRVGYPYMPFPEKVWFDTQPHWLLNEDLVADHTSDF
jgi:tRNA pseudouridine38-40 synthase